MKFGRDEIEIYLFALYCFLFPLFIFDNTDRYGCIDHLNKALISLTIYNVIPSYVSPATGHLHMGTSNLKLFNLQLDSLSKHKLPQSIRRSWKKIVQESSS